MSGTFGACGGLIFNTTSVHLRAPAVCNQKNNAQHQHKIERRIGLQEPKFMGRGAGGGAGCHVHPEIKSDPVGQGVHVRECTQRCWVNDRPRLSERGFKSAFIGIVNE